MPEITEAMDRERMQAPKKTCTGFRRLRSHWDAQGRRKTAKPRNHWQAKRATVVMPSQLCSE